MEGITANSTTSHPTNTRPPIRLTSRRPGTPTLAPCGPSLWQPQAAHSQTACPSLRSPASCSWVSTRLLSNGPKTRSVNGPVSPRQQVRRCPLRLYLRVARPGRLRLTGAVRRGEDLHVVGVVHDAQDDRGRVTAGGRPGSRRPVSATLTRNRRAAVRRRRSCGSRRPIGSSRRTRRDRRSARRHSH